MYSIYHQLLNRPYKLKVIHDTGHGRPVLFLHGLASDSNTWRYVLPLMPKDMRLIVIDLAGFGKSPKPTWPSYDVKFHTKQLKYTLNKLNVSQPITIVAHSMGGLIAIEFAKRNSKRVHGMVLCGTPLYAYGEIHKTVEDYKKTGRHVTNALFNIYERLVLDEEVTLKGAQKIMKIAPKYNSFSLNRETWIPFKKSLQNTIMNQSSLKDIKRLDMPIHFISGAADVLIVNKHQRNLSKQKANISHELVPGGHLINPLAAKKVAKATMLI